MKRLDTRSGRGHKRLVVSMGAAALAIATADTNAADAETIATIAELKAEIAALRAEVSSLKRQVGLTPTAAPAEPVTVDQGDVSPAPTPRSIEVNGDLRLRWESTSAHTGLPDRNRGVIRGRLGATYSVGKSTRLGARIVTGDPDDPNSADVSLGNFYDDLDVSLDLLFAEYSVDGLYAAGGKVPNPFVRTDLVWDGDVNPYGGVGRIDLGRDTGMLSGSLTGIHARVDEQVVADASYMNGGQTSLRFRPERRISGALHLAYFDYEIGSFANADIGDIRGNNTTEDGLAYVSDFDLFNILGSARFEGNGTWPVTLVGDYVKNLGAKVPEDTGYSVNLTVGDARNPGEYRLGYGWAVAETDAVLAAFSHDNTTYATNYKQHSFELTRRMTDKTLLYITAYRYQRKDFELVDQPGTNDWVSRVRLNLHYQF